VDRLERGAAPAASAAGGLQHALSAAAATDVPQSGLQGAAARARAAERGLAGATDGSGRHARDFYVRHDRPKRLLVRELCRNARRSLQAGRLRPALAAVEARTPPRATQSVPELRSLCAHFQRVPDDRTRIGRYPLWSLLAIVACAHLVGQHYLGSAMVEEKTNEPSGTRQPAAGSPQGSAGGRWQIPVARALFARLDLDGRKVSLDALHTQGETARALVLEHGADYLLTLKGNQPTVLANIERLVDEPGALFPSGLDAARRTRREAQIQHPA